MTWEDVPIYHNFRCYQVLFEEKVELPVDLKFAVCCMFDTAVNSSRLSDAYVRQ